jgi:hypothetical protein
MIAHRIADPRVLRLICMWLEAGVLEGGEWQKGIEATPQGAGYQPAARQHFSALCLRRVGSSQWRKRTGRGRVIIVRYADDVVMGFQYSDDARWMWLLSGSGWRPCGSRRRGRSRILRAPQLSFSRLAAIMAAAPAWASCWRTGEGAALYPLAPPARIPHTGPLSCNRSSGRSRTRGTARPYSRRLATESRIVCARPSQNISSMACFILASQQATCYPCVRNVLLPMSRVGHSGPDTIGLYALDRLFLRHRYHLGAEGILQTLQRFPLQFDVAEVAIHEADEPDAVVKFLIPTACPGRQVLTLQY